MSKQMIPKNQTSPLIKNIFISSISIPCIILNNLFVRSAKDLFSFDLKTAVIHFNQELVGSSMKTKEERKQIASLQSCEPKPNFAGLSRSLGFHDITSDHQDNRCPFSMVELT